MIEFEKAMDGVVRFLDKELFPGMADWQELIARAAMGRLFNNRAALKESLKNNGIARAFGVIDADGMIPADELRHVNLLHGEVVKLIDSHRKEHGEPPASMLAVYDYLHEKQIKAVAEVRMILQQY